MRQVWAGLKRTWKRRAITVATRPALVLHPAVGRRALLQLDGEPVPPLGPHPGRTPGRSLGPQGLHAALPPAGMPGMRGLPRAPEPSRVLRKRYSLHEQPGGLEPHLLPLGPLFRGQAVPIGIPHDTGVHPPARSPSPPTENLSSHPLSAAGALYRQKLRAPASGVGADFGRELNSSGYGVLRPTWTPLPGPSDPSSGCPLTGISLSPALPRGRGHGRPSASDSVTAQSALGTAADPLTWHFPSPA